MWNLVQFPMWLAVIVPVVNLEGIKANDLNLDGDTWQKSSLATMNKLG